MYVPDSTRLTMNFSFLSHVTAMGGYLDHLYMFHRLYKPSFTMPVSSSWLTAPRLFTNRTTSSFLSLFNAGERKPRSGSASLVEVMYSNILATSSLTGGYGLRRVKPGSL